MFTVIRALPASTPVNREVYILWGQSNMEGRGLEAAPAMYPSGRVKSYQPAGWVGASEPLQGAGVTPGVSFGTTIAALRPNVEIGLVACAYGGSSLADWARNLDPASLYGRMLAYAKEAQKWGTIKGTICDQGESDAMTSYAIANAWDTNAPSIVSQLSDDLGLDDLPTVFAIKRDNPGLAAFPYWDAMLTAQRRVSGPNIDTIETNDLAYRTDAPEQAVHRATSGQIIAGQRFAAAMNGLLTA